jgi:hypothetical protein
MLVLLNPAMPFLHWPTLLVLLSLAATVHKSRAQLYNSDAIQHAFQFMYLVGERRPKCHFWLPIQRGHVHSTALLLSKLLIHQQLCSVLTRSAIRLCKILSFSVLAY